MATQLQEEAEDQDLGTEETGLEQSAGNDDGGEPEHNEDSARALGWKPKDEYKGDPEQWRDWEDFLDTEAKNGPQIRAQNKVLARKIIALEKKFARAEKTFAEAREHFSKTEERAYNRAVTDIRKRQREAVAVGDTDAFDEASEELDELSKDVQAKSATPDAAVKAEDEKTFNKWKRGNDWYESDKAMTAYADAMAREMGPYQATGLDWDEYLDEIGAKVKKEFAHKFEQPRRRSAVEGVSETRAPRNAETFDALPAEAKAQFKRFADMDIPVTKEQYAKEAWAEIKKERR